MFLQIQAWRVDFWTLAFVAVSSWIVYKTVRDTRTRINRITRAEL